MIKCVVCPNTTNLDKREAIGLGWWTVSRLPWGNGATLRYENGETIWRCNRHPDMDLKSVRDICVYSLERRVWIVSAEALKEIA